MDSVTSAILSGAVIAAIVTSLTNLLLWRLNRKAKLQDDDQATLGEIKDQISSLKQDYEANLALNKKCFRILFSAQIREIATQAISDQEITIARKESIHELHGAYHYDCDGNGFFDQLMKDVDHLPVR